MRETSSWLGSAPPARPVSVWLAIVLVALAVLAAKAIVGEAAAAEEIQLPVLNLLADDDTLRLSELDPLELRAGEEDDLVAFMDTLNLSIYLEAWQILIGQLAEDLLDAID